jgi:hypothetical protein
MQESVIFLQENLRTIHVPKTRAILNCVLNMMIKNNMFVLMKKQGKWSTYNYTYGVIIYLYV